MHRIHHDGLYIHHSLLSEQVKPSFFSKLSDIVFKGSTNNNLYSIFYFPPIDGNLKYCFQDTSDEITDELNSFMSRESSRIASKEYKFAKSYNDGSMIIVDKRGRDGTITFSEDGLHFRYNFYAYNDGSNIEWYFSFYPFTKKY